VQIPYYWIRAPALIAATTVVDLTVIAGSVCPSVKHATKSKLITAICNVTATAGLATFL
jgi:hypothetical protein